jgi:hypothetical protein
VASVSVSGVKVTYRFLVDDSESHQERRFTRTDTWPPMMPLPYVGAYVVPAETLAAREVVRLVLVPHAEAMILEFRFDAMVNVLGPQVEALLEAGFHEIEPTPRP